MIDAKHGLSLTRQAELLALSRSSLYYEPAPVAAVDLVLMRRIDELHLELPFAGSRLLRDLLRGEGHCVFRRSRATVPKQARPSFRLMPGRW